MANDFILQLCP